MNRIQKIMQNALDAISEVNKKSVFIKNPDHQVRKATIIQLKSILRGRKVITLKKQAITKPYRKKINNALDESKVVWNTEENGLDYFRKLYGQNS